MKFQQSLVGKNKLKIIIIFTSLTETLTTATEHDEAKPI